MTNNRIKELVALKDKAKARRETATYMVEGIKMCGEAPADKVLETYVTQGFKKQHEQWLKDRDYEVVDDKVFNRISDTMTPQGVLSVLKQPQFSLDDLIKSEAGLYMILEDIQDPGNLGTIIRTAEGAGVTAVIMSRGCVDIYNPKTIRSTMGSVYRVPFVYVDDLAYVTSKMKENGITIYAAHLKGKRLYDEVNYKKTAFLIGNEGNGLKDETAALADEYIKIPMAGKVESLNAAVAASILMYEYGRSMRC
ncbi:MAG: RNA methyltransferase [Lachnospiraceae bacterium]|nr:RNA methyltransferase [Lachnospiraceae bacterium]